MSQRTHHYEKADRRFNRQKVEEFQTSILAIKEANNSRVRIDSFLDVDFVVRVSAGVTLVESRIIFTEETVFEEDIVSNSVLKKNDIFGDCGGYVCEDLSLRHEKLEPEDESQLVLEIEDDRRVYGHDSILFDVFGGHLSITSSPNRFVGMGF